MIRADFLTVLNRLLAQTDALLTPFRWGGSKSAKAAAAIAERRQLLASHGIRWQTPGSVAERKADSRLIAAMQEEGYVVSSGATTSRCLKLTAQGEQGIAPIVGRFITAEPAPWTLLVDVAALTDAGQTNTGHVWELDLLGITYKDPQWHHLRCDLEEKVLPLLSAEWLTSASDSHGAVGYQITDRGRKALAAGKPSEPDYPYYENDETLADKYGYTLKVELRARDSWTPEHPGLCAIPLSAGRWPAKAQPAHA